MVWGFPRICIRIMVQPSFATVESMFSSIVPAETSLTIFAPASTAASATEARYVSIEMEISSKAGWARINLMTGRTREISSSTVTCGALGRVDCPPMSIIETPLERSPFNVEISDEGSFVCWPPSENESGVKFKIDMICVGRVEEMEDIDSNFGE